MDKSIFEEFVDYYIKAWQNYTNFSGRARRKEFWYVFIINLLISFVLGIFQETFLGVIASLVSIIYSLAFILPGIALSIRRLHDTGRSGWWLLIGFVPIIGVIVLIVFFASDSQPGPNQYNADTMV
ncbi:hypothetical protein AWQ21_13060 [Picosynechococcus sp. PCC 7003]|uniref:DUF805 domain-containing protein n=1 Tax=Picosynechococcus sp. PCC 7003 TaxID=374981 RepID=UPI000810895D|nr:DUF805 domain-containing protein [Picosynechococcus sp. PCC 7003]ANV85221.1 hypothetical protein AWQ21_13060 [Picosynechococcus sp. PCC 7003]